MALLSLVIAALALGMWALAEWLKRPRLRIRLASWDRRSEPWMFAVVRVWNQPLPRALNWFLVRQSAEECEALLEFRKAGSSELAFAAIEGRWSNTPQPMRLVGVNLSDGSPVHVFEESIVPQTTHVNLAPTPEGQEIAVAFKRQDGAAYGWSPWSYKYGPEWRNPAWQLDDRTVYEVTVRVRASGLSLARRVKIENLDPDFTRFKTLPIPGRRLRWLRGDRSASPALAS